MTATKFIYRESTPKLAGKAKKFGASYRRMAVIEVLRDYEGHISTDTRCKGVVRIVDETTASVGTSEKSFGFCERVRLRALADTLNAEHIA